MEILLSIGEGEKIMLLRPPSAEITGKVNPKVG